MLTVLDFHMASALRHGPFRLRRRLGRTTVALAEVVGSAMSDDEHLPGHRLEWRSQVRANRPWPDWQLAAAHRVRQEPRLHMVDLEPVRTQQVRQRDVREHSAMSVVVEILSRRVSEIWLDRRSNVLPASTAGRSRPPPTPRRQARSVPGCSTPGRRRTSMRPASRGRATTSRTTGSTPAAAYRATSGQMSTATRRAAATLLIQSQ